MDTTLHDQGHFRSSSYPSSLISTIGQRMTAAMPRGNSKSDTSSPPPSVHSSPGLSHSFPNRYPGVLSKKSLSRSSSMEHILGPPLNPLARPKTPIGDLSSSLFHRVKSSPRPWTSTPKKQLPVPKEQTEGWHRTRLRVARAVSPMIDIAGDITHEVLANGAELLKFAPIAGLDGAARLLLGIWDALQQVDTNRLACLRLTERCADIMIAIHEEVSRAGKVVAQVLTEPLETLERAFKQIKTMLHNQIHQPFWKRYLKRDDILREIADCNTILQDALGHFDRSIPLKILKFVLEVSESPSGRQPPLPQSESDDIDTDTKTLPPSKAEIHERIRQIQQRQNERDRLRDSEDLERIAQITSRDAEAMEILGIEKSDIPDAARTL